MVNMVNLKTGENVQHSVYGEVELYGFLTVGDEIEIYEVEKEGDTKLDVVTTVNSDQVEFLDQKGKKHVEPLETFYEHAEM
jgi:hypothetical protein